MHQKWLTIVRWVLIIEIVISISEVVIAYIREQIMSHNLWGNTLSNIGVIVMFSLFILTPTIILYVNLREYYSAFDYKRRVRFIRTFVKGTLLALFFGVVVFFPLLTLRGEGSAVGIFIPPLMFIGGMIFSAIVSTIFYFKSKRTATPKI